MGCSASVSKTSPSDGSGSSQVTQAAFDNVAIDTARNFGLGGETPKTNLGDPDYDAKKMAKLGQVISWATSKGFVPYNPAKMNQDRAIVKCGLNGDDNLSVFGVLDGHGEFGHLVSGLIQEQLPKELERLAAGLRAQPRDTITRCVLGCVTALAESTITATFSGTTCVFGVKVDDTIHIANIGDSRAVLCRRKAGGKGIEAVALSNDHKPELPAEKARIERSGGRVERLPGAPGEDTGPYRVWLKLVPYPGLAMSRSLGDTVAASVGVSHEPEFTEHALTTDDLFIIWGSDGVWEFISNQRACEIVWENRANLKLAADALVAASTARWKEQEEVIDDITCVILALNHADYKRSSASSSGGDGGAPAVVVVE